MRRIAAFGAVFGAVSCLAAAPAIAAAPTAAPRAMIAFIPTEPAPKMPLLFDLAQRGFSYGVTSPTLGAYSEGQMLLDIGQGTRIANHAYPRDLGRLDLLTDPTGGGRIKFWGAAARRAHAAPGDVVPGLLASAVETHGGVTAYAGVVGMEQTEAVVAADERGRVRRVSLGTIGTFAQRVLGLWSRARLLVARFPDDESGLAALDQVLSGRRPEDLIIVVRAPPTGRLRLLPTGVLGAAKRAGVISSATTRRSGLVAATDFAPTVLRHLGIAVPKKMEGRPIESKRDGNPESVRQRMARLDVILGRRAPAITTGFFIFCALAAALFLARGEAGVRTALRIGFLGGLWLPGVSLVTAAVLPSRLAEILILCIGSLALGWLTDWLVPWPLGPAVPAAAVFALHTIDLARGSPWIGASLAGPNPKGGARFYGIGNELEIILGLEVLFGLGALLSLVDRRRARSGFAAGTVIAALVFGAGRLGGDGGAMITLGSGGTAAVLALLGRRLNARDIVIAVLVPVAAVGLLVGVDLITSGGAHLTRTVLQAGGVGDLLDIVKRRLIISASGLKRVTTAITCALGVALFYLGVRRRATIFAPIAE
ncbi:MAG: hypothetical protein JOZ25_10565, partial [Actinobacteria bacterium]|nr:hypothetical protein [Actinomycetota bacterium]